MKSISIAVAAFCALAGHATLAVAQSAWNDPYGDRYEDRYDRDYARQRYDNRYYPDRYGDRYYGDDYGWDAATSPEDEAEGNKTPGVSGGARPYIRPKAPPKVAFSGPYAPGSIVIDTSARKLYYIIDSKSAYAYPVGVGREGFAWSGKEKISRIADWPDWYPPKEMRERQAGLPKRMLGGINNPLGVKAIYLGNTLYRIHGTNDPKSIGKAMSSGCIRMMNANVLHLASLVHVGTEVSVVRSLKGSVVASSKTPKPAAAEPTWNNDDEYQTRRSYRRPYWDDDDSDRYSGRYRNDDDWY
jgi:lipoprotein-anchoring transpeptidase ErfK/SrfK